MKTNFAPVEAMENIINNKSFNTMEIHMIYNDSGREFYAAKYDAKNIFCYDGILAISGENILECFIPYDRESVTYDEESETYEFVTEGVRYWILF